jgi:adenine/guanine phosphoribosyltransferase-like PRPP-binding protein
LVRVLIVAAPGVADIVARCASDVEVVDRSGQIGRGFTNLKRVLGSPREFKVVVEELANTVPQGHALAGADEGSWALVGALALNLGVPAVLVRRIPKTYFVSYGDDPTVGYAVISAA